MILLFIFWLNFAISSPTLRTHNRDIIINHTEQILTHSQFRTLCVWVRVKYWSCILCWATALFVPHSHILVVPCRRRSPISLQTQIHNKLLIRHTVAVWVVWERRNRHVLTCVRCIIASEFRVSLTIKPTVVFLHCFYLHVLRNNSHSLT